MMTIINILMLRVRPVSQKETKANDDSIIQFPGEGQIWVTDHHHQHRHDHPGQHLYQQVDEAKGNLKPFTFNVVFEPEATQADVLEHSGMKRYLHLHCQHYLYLHHHLHLHNYHHLHLLHHSKCLHFHSNWRQSKPTRINDIMLEISVPAKVLWGAKSLNGGHDKSYNLSAITNLFFASANANTNPISNN